VRRLAEHLPELRRRIQLQAVYTDLDGTLFGPGSSLFADAEGGVTTRPAEAVAALHRAGVALVPMSGRTRAQVREAARILGARDFIAELGGLLCLDGEAEVVLSTGDLHEQGSAVEAMARSGAAAILLEAFPGRLEPHAPWAFEPREVTMLFRGLVDPNEAREVLERAGHGALEIRDNGVIGRGFPDLEEGEVHAYHLLPRGVSKAAAMADHAQRRGIPPEGCVVIGDSETDAEIAGLVGAVCIVANGASSVSRSEDVYVTESPYGEGFAEVVTGLLEAAPD
jgi:hydroxymethylpyrimidine pyrophosphatase-like HAD family hydrolase